MIADYSYFYENDKVKGTDDVKRTHFKIFRSLLFSYDNTIRNIRYEIEVLPCIEFCGLKFNLKICCKKMIYEKYFQKIETKLSEMLNYTVKPYILGIPEDVKTIYKFSVFFNTQLTNTTSNIFCRETNKKLILAFNILNFEELKKNGLKVFYYEEFNKFFVNECIMPYIRLE